MYHILNQLSVDGHLGYFHVLAIVNSSAMECIYLFELEFSSFPDIYPGVGLLDLTVALFLVFKAISILFFIVAEAIYIPINSVGGVPFLYILINT